MVVSPYGFWSSPITSDLAVADAIWLDQVALDGNAIYWTDLSRRSKADTSSTALLKGKSLSLLRPMMRTTSMFELACTNTVAGHLLWRMVSFTSPTSLISGFIGKMLDNYHALSRHFGRMRFDMQMAVYDRRRGRIICVQEDHTLPGKVINTLVSIDITGVQAPRILACGFYLTPRLNPDGNRLVWLSWNYLNMPWLTTEAWVGEVANDGMLRNARRVAGGADEALFQPEWSPDGDLYLVSDQGKGWWNSLSRARRCTRTDGA